jgi:hypothetical protein
MKKNRIISYETLAKLNYTLEGLFWFIVSKVLYRWHVTPGNNKMKSDSGIMQHHRCWAQNTSGQNRKEKKNILNTLYEFDKKAENTPLSSNEIDLKQYLNNRLAEMLREEEIKWYQRAKVKELLEGDSNTKYFQLVANWKYRKTRIFQLQHGDKIIEGDAPLE